MEKIKKMIVYDDGLIELYVECNKCNHINIHRINYETKNQDNIIINFSTLGKRRCDGISNFKDPENSKCKHEYVLYP